MTIKITTTSATITTDSSFESKQIWLKVEQSFTDQKTRTRLDPTQALQLAYALIHHALRVNQEIPPGV